ncbi:MAG TPA: hypothetical protein VJZ32_09685 [Candidatus Bathyarchaeia archaeon]|nr:hypothetical protein [Candidatus Bathyarchaeia archaeon]
MLLVIAILIVTLFAIFPRFWFGGFGGDLGWIALTISVILIVQSFMKTWTRSHGRALRRSQNHSQLELQEQIRSWRGLHVTLSVLVTAFAGLHGIVFFWAIRSFFYGYLAGVAAFVFLLVLGLSGITLDRKRGDRTFRRLNYIHLALTVIVLWLAVIHVLTSTTTFVFLRL